MWSPDSPGPRVCPGSAASSLQASDPASWPQSSLKTESKPLWCRWETGAQGGDGLAQDRTEPEPGPRFPVRPGLPFCPYDPFPLHLGLPCPSPATVWLSALRTDGLGRPLCPGAPGEGADLTAWPKGQCWPAVFPAPAGVEAASPCARTWSPKERVRLFPWPPVSREKRNRGSVAGRRGGPAARRMPRKQTAYLEQSPSDLPQPDRTPRPVPGASPPALLFPRCLFPATVRSFPRHLLPLSLPPSSASHNGHWSPATRSSSFAVTRTASLIPHGHRLPSSPTKSLF